MISDNGSSISDDQMNGASFVVSIHPKQAFAFDLHSI